MKKIAIFLLLLFFTFSISQEILMQFPAGQDSYKGGNIQFYKDFNTILKEIALKPCEDKNEVYSFGVLINPDDKISFIADDVKFEDTKTDCSKLLSREVAKYLKGWNAATKDGKKVPAVATFLIIPSQLFGTLKDGYDVNTIEREVLPEFPGGLRAFRNLAAIRVDTDRYRFATDTTIEITFVVERDGSVNEVKLAQSSGLKEFDDMMTSAVSGIRKKWKPATISGIPVRYRFRIPFKFLGSGY